MGAPRGCWGVHSGPEGGALIGAGPAPQDLAGDAALGLCCREARLRKSHLGVVMPVPRPQSQAAPRDHAEAPPRPVAWFEHVIDHRPGPLVPLTADRSDVLVLHLRPSLLRLLDDHPDALQQIQRFEPGHHDGDAEIARDGLVVLPPRHRAHVTGSQEPLDQVPGGPGWPALPAGPARGRPGGRNSPPRARGPGAPPWHWPAPWSRTRRRRTPPPPGLGPRDLQGVQRRVDHPDVAALGPRSQQVVLRAGTRSMSPKEHSVVPGTRAKWMAWSMIARA